MAALLLARVIHAEPGAALVGASGGSRTFEVQGTVRRVEADGTKLLISHEAVSNYMPAMTMPFQVSSHAHSPSLRAGDRIQFQLHVTADESWIDHIKKTGSDRLLANPPAVNPAGAPPAPAHHPLLDCQFTNELGQPVRLADFRGQALAITFFFTRCPVPDFCPRLSRNFQEVARKLETTASSPTNWHLLSISFDPEYDSPSVLQAYGRTYHYDPKHWSFITGPADKIHELAALSGVTFEADSGLYNHNFRTLIIDANGHLQMVFPTSGDLSEAIIAELLKAAAVTNGAS